MLVSRLLSLLSLLSLLFVSGTPLIAGQEGLATRVEGALAACELLPGSSVTVSAKGGVVTLGGHVRTLRERECVAVRAEQVAGVRFLQPNTVVRPDAPVDDEALVSRLREALRERHDFAGPAPLTVTAEEGLVVLGGQVRVPDDKYRAEEVVRRVEGVLAFENAVTVDPQRGLRSMEVELLELFRIRQVSVTDLRFLEEEGRVVVSGRSHDVVAQSLTEEFIRLLPGGRMVATRIHLVLRPSDSDSDSASDEADSGN